MSNPKDKLASALDAVHRAASEALTPKAVIPSKRMSAAPEAARERAVQSLEALLKDAKDGKIEQLIVVGSGPTGTVESICVRGDEAARMIGLLALTQSRLTASLAAMADSRPLPMPGAEDDAP